MQIVVTNPASNPGNLTGVSISDSYAGFMTNNAVGSVVCSGAGSATLNGGANGGSTVGFSAGTIVPGGTCTITQSVTATSTYTNTTGAPAATGPVALTGIAASSTLTVTPIADVTTTVTVPANANAGSVVNGTATYSNNGPSTAAGTTYTFTMTAGLGTVNFPTLPSGVTASYNNATGTVTLTGMPGSLTSGQIAELWIQLYRPGNGPGGGQYDHRHDNL